MSRNRQTYQQITDLCTRLRSETAITKRRKTGDELLDLLSDDKVQARIAKEARYSRKAICTVWRLAVNNALHSAERAMDGKAKPKTMDIILPYKIMLAADKDTSHVQHNVFVNADKAGGGGADNTDGLNKTKLSNKEVTKLLQFCLAALSNDESKSVADREMLAMLNALCCRPDYVVHFHPPADVAYILAEVQTRVLTSRRPDAVAPAAKAFANLMHQLTFRLGIGMHNFLAPSIDLVANWCRQSMRDQSHNAGEASLPYMYSVVTNLIATHPEQSVAVMEQHGRHLLGYAKKCFSQSANLQRDALIEYFSAHLLVCEVAGKLQGLLPGDLGDLGSASLDSSQINSLVSLVVLEKEFEKSFSDSALPASTAPARSKGRTKVGDRSGVSASRKRKQRSSNAGSRNRRSAVTWMPLSKRQRRHLELCARLLRCAQRYWAGRAELLSTDDPTQMLEKDMEDGESRQASTNDKLLCNLSEAPWITRVASRVCAFQFSSTSAEPTSTVDASLSQSGVLTAARERVPSADKGLLQRDIIEALPMMKAIADMNEAETNSSPPNRSSAISYLRLICACAEAFPRGECWSLNNEWKESAQKKQDGGVPYLVRYTFSSPLDIASVIFTVSTLLESFGGASGDQTVQLWALVCLLKLTEPSVMACRHSKDRTAVKVLNEVWASVWTALFRPDLQYSSYTASAFIDSVGELVIMLLTEIIARRLTDPMLGDSTVCNQQHIPQKTVSSSPLFPNQSQVWSLPAYKDASCVQSRALFELTSQFIGLIGLSDHGADVIHSYLPSTMDETLPFSERQGGSQTQVGQGRRHRLLAFCLRFIEQAMTSGDDDSKRQIFPLACECLSVVIGRNGLPLPTSYALGASRQYRMVEDSDHRHVGVSDFLSEDPFDSSLASLWQDSLIPFAIEDSNIVEGDERIQRLLRGQGTRLSIPYSSDGNEHLIVKTKDQSASANFVATSMMRSLQDIAIDFVRQVISAQTIVEGDTTMDDGDSEGDLRVGTNEDGEEPVRICNALGAQVFVTLALSTQDASSSVDVLEKMLSSDIETMLDGAILSLKQSNDFANTLVGLIGVFRAFLCLSASGSGSIVKLFGEKAQALFDTCRTKLALYPKRLDETLVPSPSPSHRTRGGKVSRHNDDLSSSEEEGNQIEHETFEVDNPNESFDEFSDDDDMMDGRTSQRRRANAPPSRKRQRRSMSSTSKCSSSFAPSSATNNDKMAPPEPRGAWLCAAAMALIEPSSECCQTVAEYLVWPEEDDDEGRNEVADPDPRDGVVVVSLFSNSDALLRQKRLGSFVANQDRRDDGDEEWTVCSLCTQIILEIRTYADASSFFHMFGFGASARLVLMGDSTVPSESMNEGNVRDIVNVLHPEGSKEGNREVLKLARRSLKRRPHVRGQQLQSATLAFQHGGGSFHISFDGTFAGSFVIPGLCNIDSEIRHAAVDAVGAALSLLPNQHQIVETVVKNLVPLPVTNDDEKIERKFERWIQDRVAATSEEEVDRMEMRAWRDAQTSLECSAIQCRGIIAASTSESGVARQMILHLINLSSVRPAFRSLCFHACERAAVARGFPRLEDLLLQEREWLLQEMLASGRELALIPILVSSPFVVRALLRVHPGQASFDHDDNTSMRPESGKSDNENGPADLSGKYLDVDRLEESAAIKYVQDSATSLVPLIMLMPSNENRNDQTDRRETDDGSSNQEGWSKESWGYFNVCVRMLLDENSDVASDGDIALVLKNHLSDIYAFVFPILQGGCWEEDNELAKANAMGALKRLKSCISEEKINRHGAKISSAVVLELLYLSGKEIAYGKVKVLMSSFKEAIEYCKTSLPPVKRGGLFEGAGSSSTECLLHAKKWLDEAVVTTQEDRAWKVIAMICDEIIGQIADGNETAQLGFTIHSLLSILLERRFAGIHTLVLQKLSDILIAALAENAIDRFASEIAPILNELTLALIQLHELSQQKLLSFCLTAWREEQKNRRRSMGLLQNHDNRGDVWGWDDDATEGNLDDSSADEIKLALSAYRKKMDDDTVTTMVTCYDLLEMIFLKSPSNLNDALQTLDPLPANTASKDELNALKVATESAERSTLEDYKFSCEALLVRFEDRRDKGTALSFEEELSKFLSFAKVPRNVFSSESNQLNVQARSQLSGLSHLESVLRNHLKDTQATDAVLGPLLYKMLQELFGICNSKAPDEIRCASSRCIGELSSFDLASLYSCETSADGPSGGENTDGASYGEPLLQTQLVLMELLAKFIQCSNSKTAIIAMDTAKHLLSTKEGSRCFRKVPNDVKRVLGPLVTPPERKFSRSNVPKIDDSYLDMLATKSGTDARDARSDPAWCWNDALWTCEGEGSYENWVKDVVCAMLCCCYSSTSHADSSTADGKATGIKGRGEFFYTCTKMCATEHDFAAAMFPGIVYDLLSSDKGKGKGDALNDTVRREIAVGSPRSDANRTLTRCFSRLIGPPAETPHSVAQQRGTDPKALCLAVDTLDFLRCVLQHRFLQSTSHRRNKVTLSSNKPADQEQSNQKRRKSSSPPASQSDKDYNAGLAPPPEWNGVPFGVVLHLSGVDVASACLRAKRFASALFYANMFADNRLGGSGGVLERMSSENGELKERQTAGISGSGLQLDVPDDGLGSPESMSDMTAALSLSGIIKECLSALHEPDGLKGVEAQESSMRFNQDGGFRLDDDFGSTSDNWASLVDLDTRLQQTSCNPTMSADSMNVASRLDSLGLRHILKNYMAGLENHAALSLSALDQEELKEQWFHESWRALQWDDSLLCFDQGKTMGALTAGTQAPPLPTQSISAPRISNKHSTTGAENTPTLGGFHEALFNSFGSALSEDAEHYSKHVMEARYALLIDMNATIGHESLLSGISDFSARFKVLNEVQDIEEAYFGEKPSDLLPTMGFPEIGNSTFALDAMNDLDSKINCHFSPSIDFPSQELSLSVREVTLRIGYNKFHENETGGFSHALISHLSSFCSIARQHGRPDIADASLRRLSRVLELCESRCANATSKFNASMRLHLEEAKVKNSQGLHASAIRIAKLIVNSVRRNGSENPRDDDESSALLSEALGLCGEWMIGYKIESGKNVLGNHLQPASDAAMRLYKRNKSEANASRASEANFTLGEFVASLYDGVEAKVKSQEWIKAGVIAEERKKELQFTNDLIASSKKELEKSERGKGRSGRGSQSEKAQTELQSARKKYQELRIHVTTLRAEVKMDAKERKAVEASAIKYLLLAIQSYGTALSICNPASMTGDVSKHVFRMVSLWFTNSHRSDSAGNVNKLIDKFRDTIPSYLLVPLTYQIFSRIDKAESTSEVAFQTALRGIVSRIAAEHPYHTLVQLIALSNGDNVGRGVGGHQASVYLENVGGSKVEATKSILQDLKKSGPDYVSSLIDSSTVLTDSYIELAMCPTEKFTKDKNKQPKNIPLSSVKTGSSRGGKPSLDRCLGSSSRSTFSCLPCVLTKPPKLRPAGDYGDGKEDPIGSERVVGFDATFNLTDTGIHRPKIVICRGSRGGSFKQLVKGEDDIRQDAVMQQVFSTVNNLLRRQHGSSTKSSASRNISSQVARQLKVVTYNIIPLSPTSGVLEWVTDTLPFGAFLTDKSRSKGGRDVIGAHSRYYPGEWGHRLAQSHFMNAPPNAKREAFDEICKRFSPAFRFFFVERFSYSLQAWHAARTLYTMSCAVNSIVGHILGIGDRHAHNILVHQKTGEVVHIDFGIVFEQGKCLATPETIPFRLTRDIVDGMGPSGTEGCFSLAAEATASVLRENAGTLLTILSAVVSDPLYKWSVSPVKARQCQRGDRDGDGGGGDDDEGNEAGDNILNDGDDNNTPKQQQDDEEGPPPAENQNDAANRAIKKIHEKLQGYEEGMSGERQSVEGQVQLLINSARDPDNLCALYHGWCPWL